jgi:hypothetical protein
MPSGEYIVAMEGREMTQTHIVEASYGIAGTYIEHDGVTEWADCADCGSHIDGTSIPSDYESESGRWEGDCPYCGASTMRVGLVAHYRVGASLDRDGQMLDMDQAEVLGEEYRRAYVTRASAEQAAQACRDALGETDLDPDTTYSVIEC